MLVNKNAFEMLLQAWWGLFEKKWVTAKEIIDLANDEAFMRERYEGAPRAPDWGDETQKLYPWLGLRCALDNLAAKKISGDDLDSVLDEVKNKIVFNFLVERDGSRAQPLKWRVLLQD